jgi:hypothetical protein
MKLVYRVFFFLAASLTGPSWQRQGQLRKVGPELIDFTGCYSVRSSRYKLYFLFFFLTGELYLSTSFLACRQPESMHTTNN